MTFDEIKTRFHDRIRNDQGDKFTCVCPGHDDDTASLAIARGKDGKTLINCFAGCEPAQILNPMDMAVRDLFSANGTHRNGAHNSKSTKSAKTVATYDYRDQSGKLIFHVQRKEPKSFSQCRPDGDGGLVYNMDGVSRVLYRLPELMDSDRSDWVLIPEGEKDVENLRRHRYIATTNAGGANAQWLDSYSESLRGRKVCILPDNDDAGRKHANDVASHLVGIASDVRILALPDLPEKGDFSDWIEAGNDPTSLLAMVENAPLFSPDDHIATTLKPNDTWPYGVDGGRIVKYFMDREGNVESEPLCNFVAWITGDVQVDDGENVTRKVVVEGKLANGTPLPEVEIKASEFEAMQWVVSSWGARASISAGRGTKDTLRHAIQVLSEGKMRQKTSRSHTGWATVGDKRIFLHAGGAVGGVDAGVSLPKNLVNYFLPNDDAVDPVAAMRESIALMDIAPRRVSAPLWAATYAAPLTEIIIPAFTLFLEGGSGARKSSYSAVLLNHFGAKFDEYHMPADWLSTANSLEKLSFHAKDVLLIIDDLRPSTSQAEHKELMSSANKIVRAAGNRSARGRLTADSEFKQSYTPRGVVLVTAERKAMGKSTNSRILTVDVEPGDIDLAKLSVAQKQRHVYGYAMRGYIEWVAENWDTLATALPQQIQDVRSLSNGGNLHGRLPNATAVLYTAFNCAMNYAVSIGVINQDEAKKRMKECFVALMEIAERQNESTQDEDPAVKYVTIIASLIAQNKAHVLGKGAKPTLGNESGERLGWHNGHNVYLLPSAYNAVCSYASREGWSFPSDESTLRKELDRAGYISQFEQGKLTTKQRVPGGKPISVTAISYNKLAELLTEMGVDL